jgi:catechol 2,3-dioxygenase-like lactoylglutathione lyase family enzyme
VTHTQEDAMTDTTSPRPTRITGVRTVAVPVADQDRALDFYVATLGFDTVLDVPMGDGPRWIEVAPPGAPTSLALVLADAAAPAGTDTGIRLVSEDPEADHAALQANGVDADEVLRWPGVPLMFSFRDADGNRLVVIGAS